MYSFSTIINSCKTNLLLCEYSMLKLASPIDAKSLFDHRTNQRAHPGRGGHPRG